MRPPRECRPCHATQFRLNDRASRFIDFRWECLRCGHPAPSRTSAARRCPWTEKRMAPHGSHRVVRLRRARPHARHAADEHSPRCADPRVRPRDHRAMAGGMHEGRGRQVLRDADTPPATRDSRDDPGTRGDRHRDHGQGGDSAAVLPAGPRKLGRAWRRCWDTTRSRDERGPALAHNLAVYEQALGLPRLTLDDLETTPARPAGPPAMRPTGRCCALRPGPGETAVAGSSRHLSRVWVQPGRVGAGRGRPGRLQGAGRPRPADHHVAVRDPTETEALVFALDQGGLSGGSSATAWSTSTNSAPPVA